MRAPVAAIHDHRSLQQPMVSSLHFGCCHLLWYGQPGNFTESGRASPECGGPTSQTGSEACFSLERAGPSVVISESSTVGATAGCHGRDNTSSSHRVRPKLGWVMRLVLRDVP